jgi:hypothetical protein
MAAPVVAKKSFRDGRVALAITLKARGWGNDEAKISGSTELTTAQARALAQELIARADEADAKVTKKAEAQNRRRKWRDREIAAGRMVMIGGLRG